METVGIVVDELGRFMKLVALKFLGSGGDFMAMWQYMDDFSVFFNPHFPKEERSSLVVRI